MRLLFFIESLRSGGKERRLLELVQFLKFSAGHEIILVLTEKSIHYDYVYNWNVPVVIIERKGLKKDPRIFYKFYKVCASFRPNVIHTWGIMNTFYAIPAKLCLNIPLISSMISNAEFTPKRRKVDMFFYKMSFIFSDRILANSIAGLNAYGVESKKAKVIYNGVNIERFENSIDVLKIRESLSVKTPYLIVMVASVNKNKNYDLFVDVAKEIGRFRSDITFIGVGGGDDIGRINSRIKDENIQNITLVGLRRDVESIVSASDIGVLFSYCEGFPNSVMEYMALKKPVVVSDEGGSKELVIDNEVGYLVRNDDLIGICEKVVFLIDNEMTRLSFGLTGYDIIKNRYSIEKMSVEFMTVYNSFRY